MNPVVQSLWIGNELSQLEKLCIASFINNSFDFHLYVYEEINSVPKGVILKDASKVVHPERIFKYKNYDTYSGFANLFRYALLLNNGGYWVDLDIICLKPFDFEFEYIFAGQRIQNRKEVLANNCIIKSPVASPIMEYCYAKAASINPDELAWGQTGPVLLTEAILKHDLANFIASPDIFCPIAWWDWKRAIDDSFNPNEFKDSYTIHLWNEMWRRNNQSKSRRYSDNCLFEKYKKKYL